MGFVTGGPNEAIVVSGCFHSQPLIVVGGWAFVIPCIQKVQRLPLNIMTLKVASPTVYTMQGVPLSVTGIAQVFVYIFHFFILPINVTGEWLNGTTSMPKSIHGWVVDKVRLLPVIQMLPGSE